MKYIKVVFFVLLIGSTIQVTAQRKVTKPVAAVKYKAPKLQTLLGNYKDSASVSVEEGSNLIGTALKIVGDKNNPYSIVSYQFLYKKIGVTEDEQTEKISPVTTISSSYFNASPLPAVWINTIQQFLKPGEEFYFFDVIVKDAKGNNMFAPTLKLTIR